MEKCYADEAEPMDIDARNMEDENTAPVQTRPAVPMDIASSAPSIEDTIIADTVAKMPQVNMLIEVCMVNGDETDVEWCRGFVAQVHRGGRVCEANTDSITTLPHKTKRRAPHFRTVYHNGYDFDHYVSKQFKWRHIKHNEGRLLNLYSSRKLWVAGRGDDAYYEVVVVGDADSAGLVEIHYVITLGTKGNDKVARSVLQKWDDVPSEDLPSEGQALCDMV